MVEQTHNHEHLFPLCSIFPFKYEDQVSTSKMGTASLELCVCFPQSCHTAQISSLYVSPASWCIVMAAEAHLESKLTPLP